MSTFMMILTYGAYIFIIAMYTVKGIQWLKKPVHIRWELYPVIHEDRYKYGGSYYEEQEWWEKPRSKNFWRSLFYALKDNFYLGEYFKRNRGYWLVLYPWHMGFILIISFHILCFFGAVAMHFGFRVFSGSPDFLGNLLYYFILFTGNYSLM